MDYIPFNRPYIIGNELKYISQAVVNEHLSGNGEYAQKCQNWMEKEFKARKVFLTNSCTSALEMSALLCNIEPGDEVILPSFTFVSTANAFVLFGAKPKFIDIHPDTLNINENQIESCITNKTKAIIPVHYAGVSCNMDKILKIGKKYNIKIVEDAAQAVNARYNGNFLGTLGDMGCYSFHETKNYICGEGGALVINNEDLIQRADILYEKGTNRKNFNLGIADKYVWMDVGSTYYPSEIVAAFLFAQLEKYELINSKRLEIYQYYFDRFMPLQEKGYLNIPYVPDGCVHNGHLFYLLLSDENTRNSLLKYLNNDKGINAVFHFVPLHSSPMGKKFGYKDGDMPITENISKRILRLPCFFDLIKEKQDMVINSVYSFFGL